MSTGYIAALATLCCWTVSTFVFAKLSRQEDSYVLNKAALFFSIFLSGILVCAVDRLAPWQLFTLPAYSNWYWLGLSGILGKSVGDYCGFRALRILGARRRSMVSTLGPGFTWFFGFIILSEQMNWLGFLGMLLTILSLLLLLNSSFEKVAVKKENFGLPLPGLLFGTASAGLTGLAFILSKKTIIESGESISAFHATWIRILVAFIALVIVDMVRNRHTGFINKFLWDKEKAMLLFWGILFGAVLGLSFSLVAITTINAAAAYTIFSLVPVSVMLVNVIAYKKRITALSWLYSFMAVTGALVIVWRDSILRYF